MTDRLDPAPDEQSRDATASSRAVAPDTSVSRTLTDADVEAIADVVASRLGAPADRWLTVEQVAELLRVSADFVYTHQQLLGVRRLGTGRRAPLRFRHDLVVAGIERLSAPKDARAPRPERRPRGSRRRASQPRLGGLKARPI